MTDLETLAIALAAPVGMLIGWLVGSILSPRPSRAIATSFAEAMNAYYAGPANREPGSTPPSS